MAAGPFSRRKISFFEIRESSTRGRARARLWHNHLAFWLSGLDNVRATHRVWSIVAVRMIDLLRPAAAPATSCRGHPKEARDSKTGGFDNLLSKFRRNRRSGAASVSTGRFVGHSMRFPSGPLVRLTADPDVVRATQRSMSITRDFQKDFPLRENKI